MPPRRARPSSAGASGPPWRAATDIRGAAAVAGRRARARSPTASTTLERPGRTASTWRSGASTLQKWSPDVSTRPSVKRSPVADSRWTPEPREASDAARRDDRSAEDGHAGDLPESTASSGGAVLRSASSCEGAPRLRHARPSSPGGAHHGRQRRVRSRAALTACSAVDTVVSPPGEPHMSPPPERGCGDGPRPHPRRSARSGHRAQLALDRAGYMNAKGHANPLRMAATGAREAEFLLPRVPLS